MRPKWPRVRPGRGFLLGLAAVLAAVVQVAPDPGRADDLVPSAFAPAAVAQAAVAPSAFAPAGWAATFDGRPGSPQPWRPTDWDVTVHSRDPDTWTRLEGMHAAHGPGCESSPSVHPIGSYDDAVFLCNDHVMTAINASGYGLISLTPNRAVDFARGEAVVRFDMSTLRTSGRDWISLWISPFEDHLQLPLADWLPDLSGEPRRGVELRMDFNGGVFRGAVVRDFRSEELPSASTAAYEEVLSPSAVRRDTFELRISRTRIAFGMPQYGLRWIDTPIDDLGWSRGLLQFQHHSYTPHKDCPDTSCSPNTWH